MLRNSSLRPAIYAIFALERAISVLPKVTFLVTPKLAFEFTRDRMISFSLSGRSLAGQQNALFPMYGWPR